MTPDLLPEFERPPVVETILGVQLDRLSGCRNAHLGAFWKSLGDDWPTVSDAPPLEPQFERFEESQAWGQGLQFSLSQNISIRVQIRNVGDDRMVQVQNDRLIYNWLGHDGRPYPRYKEVRPEFDAMVARFKEFVARESIGEFRPNQWEVTYVNHLPKGTVWNFPADWAELFRSPVCFPTGAGSLALESLGGEWHFEIPPKHGRLHIHIQHGRRPGADEVLVVTLTARGPTGDAGGIGLTFDEGIDLGHKTIVSAFKDITSASAHKYWGIQDA
jgi:uncharacterized protein (TIGR04255 family)